MSLNIRNPRTPGEKAAAVAGVAACMAGAAAAMQATGSSSGAQASGQIDRTVLPIAQPPRPFYTELDARQAKAPRPFEVKAPEGAPNVLVVLIDDVGFGAASTFGGPVATPTLDRLAQGGLKYNNFHTTALSSPTRVALKTGRNHHIGEMGTITEMATGFPGYTGQIPDSVASIGEMLRLNGYSTAAFGKWHETAVWETSVSGPLVRWPTLQGFDKFYGFIGGESNQWAPFLFDGVTQVEPPDKPNYHFLTDMTDKTVAWIDYQKAITPDKPFMVYYAPGAVHAPHHVPPEYIAKWKGKFDQGWDKLREETLARQIKLGIVPAGTTLARKPSAIKDWDTLSPDEKKLFAHQAEVYAAFLDMTDHEVGRVVKAIDDAGQLDNTLIFYIVGDNGTSAEGGANGMFNEYTYFNGVQEQVSDMLKVMDKWGSPETYPHMAAGWAVAFDTPFAWTKQVASDYGGTNNGMVVSWPKHITQCGELRSQFGHVIDIVPTILEAANLPQPKIVNGTPQEPIQGTSLVYTFDDGNAKERHGTQYFEILGNRGIYSDGWFARTVHKAPWEPEVRRPLAQDAWELYNTRQDFSLAHDLASANPQKLAELQTLFMKEAKANHVLPLDDRVLERASPALAGRPDIMAGRTSLTLAEGMTGMLENVFLNVKNKSVTITAEIEAPQGGGNGTILAQGGRFGGWELYVKDGHPGYVYNFLGLQRFSVVSPQTLASGPSTIKLDFAYDGGGMGKGGTATLFVNGTQVAQGRIDRTQGMIFSADETADVGIDLGTPVVEAVGSGERSRFTGHIPKVTIEVRGGSAAADAAVRKAWAEALLHIE